MIRFGLCCKFSHADIHFYTTTATSLLRLKRREALLKLSRLCLANALSLRRALEYCSGHDIGSFRVNSEILPIKTHPEAGYAIRDLPDAREIIRGFETCREFARQKGLRLTFHPDQFVVLSSADQGIVDRSIADLEYQAEVAEWIGADVINIHGGGAYGDKPTALSNVRRNVRRLSRAVRRRLTFENDERTYSPKDLLAFCQGEGVPFVYDVHHHRCLPDGLTVEDVTKQALKTWNREPLFHISSPREGWGSRHPSYHHDYVDVKDFPVCWRQLPITIEVEAKAKELAIKKLQKNLKALQ